MLTTTTNKNIDVNSNKISLDDNPVELTLIPTLKRSRTEARSINPSSVTWHASQKSNIKHKIDVERRLLPFKDMLESLLKSTARQIEEFTSSILSWGVKLIHWERQARFRENTPSFYSTSPRLKFELTYKEKLKELKKKAKKIVTEAKDTF